MAPPSCFSICCGSSTENDVVVNTNAPDEGNEGSSPEQQSISEEQSHGVIASAKKCYTLAKETLELCQTTVTKGQTLVEFGTEIRTTLVDASHNMTAETLTTIKDLIQGDKTREAKELAMQMDDMALECINKSIEMVHALNEGVDALPDWIEKYVEDKADKLLEKQEEGSSSEQHRDLLLGVEQDQSDLEECMDAIQNLNLLTAMDAGKRAFDGITSKSDKCRQMFDVIATFCTKLVGITKAFDDVGSLKWTELKTASKDILECIGLSKLIQEFATQCGALIKKVVDLFGKASDKLGELWSALSYAKDCLVDCIDDVKESFQLTQTAKDRSIDLKERTKDILETLKEFNDDHSFKDVRQSFKAIKQMIEQKHIQEAIELSKTMDDILLESVSKTKSVISKVSDGYQNLPPILTSELSSDNMIQIGTTEDDPDEEETQRDVEQAVEVLQKSNQNVETSDVTKAIQCTYQAIKDADDNIDKTQTMLDTTQQFSMRSQTTLDSFLGSWNLEDATSKLREMCRLVKLGELAKKFCEFIKQIIQAIMTLLKTIQTKFEKWGDKLEQEIRDVVPDKIEHVFDSATDAFGSFLGKLGGKASQSCTNPLE